MKLQRIKDAPSGNARIEVLIGIEEARLLQSLITNGRRWTPRLTETESTHARMRQMFNELSKGLKDWMTDIPKLAALAQVRGGKVVQS